MKLRAGDIVVVHGRSWISRAIRALTRSPGEAPTRASHVGVVVDAPQRGPACVVEALSRGVVLRPLPDGYAHAIYRPTNLTRRDRSKVAHRALSFVGRRYGWAKIALHALDGALGGAYFFRRLAALDHYPICSYVVAAAFAEAGYTFGVATGAATPDDVEDFCRARPDRYRRIL